MSWPTGFERPIMLLHPPGISRLAVCRDRRRSPARRLLALARTTFAPLVAIAALTGCAVEAPPPPSVPVAYAPAPPRSVISVYVEPPLYQPAPVLIGWAPPPLLVDPPPPQPFADAVWVGGYWTWRGAWVWAAGHWVAPPQPGYVFVQPYYEHRGDDVVFVAGHWGRPGYVFVPPPPTLHLELAVALPGVVPGPRPIGPPGVFIPPPPGSRAGLIVPAPLGTAPAVVTGAPPVVHPGMRIDRRPENDTHITNVTNITNVTRVSNVNNVTIVAPASATASGRAYDSLAPARAHLAAAQKPVVQAAAPPPVSRTPVAAYGAEHPPAALPPAQPVPMKPRPAAAPTHVEPASREAAQPEKAAQAAKPAAAKPERVPGETAQPTHLAKHDSAKTANAAQEQREREAAAKAKREEQEEHKKHEEQRE